MLRLWRVFKVWLEELNRFDHVYTLSVVRQRLITRIYIILLTFTVIGLLIYTSLLNINYTQTIRFPSSEDFQKIKSLKYVTAFSCPCHNIIIPYKNFIQLKPTFHPICSSQFVTNKWSNGLFYENASLYMPSDIRSTLSAQLQLLSSFCSIAQQTVHDEIEKFESTQFISTQAISNDSIQIQVDALVSAFQSNAPSSLLRALSLVRQTIFSNHFLSAITSNSMAIMYTDDSQYAVGQLFMRYKPANESVCMCDNSSVCYMPVGIFEDIMPTNLDSLAEYYVPIDNSLTIFNGLYAGCMPIESLLTSSLDCFYDERCLSILEQYLPINISLSVLTLSNNSQFTPNSTVLEIMQQLFVQQWNVNISYDMFFNACAPSMCTYTYIKSANFIYIATTMLGFYGGLEIALKFLIVILIKYLHRRQNTSNQINQNLVYRSKIERFQKVISELNLFAEKDKLTIDQQRFSTRLFLVLFSSAILILVLFSMSTKHTYTRDIDFPTQINFERLQILYPNTLSCSCSQMIIPQQQFIKLSPNFHTICSSVFISQEWFDALTSLTQSQSFSFVDFRPVALLLFQQIKMFCSLANQTIADALVIFDNTPFISQHVSPASTLNIESNSTINTFIRLTQDTFALQIKFIQNTSYGNQLISAFFNNHQIKVINSSIDNFTVAIDTRDYTYGNCSCILKPAICTISSNIFSDEVVDNQMPLILSIPSIYVGCFGIDSIFVSKLECFYNQSCLDALQPYIPGFNFSTTALIKYESSQYNPNTPLGEIIKNLLVENWNISVSYENYFSYCAPQLCTYSYESRGSLIYLITTLFSLVGGLFIAFKIISPYAISIFSKNDVQNVDIPIVPFRIRLYNLFVFVRSLPSQIRESIITLNLYKEHGQAEDEERIHAQQNSTRLYLFLLIFSLIILVIYQTISNNTFSETIQNPSPTTFENLYNKYSDMLTCPCNEISMSYSDFVDIEFEFHPVCSSDFVTEKWFNSLFNNPNTFIYSDFRTTALALFRLLSSFCELANDTLINAKNSFLSDKFLNTKIISYENFVNQIQVAIELFQLNAHSTFIQSLQLIRYTTSDNALITVYSTSWKFIVNEISVGAILPTESMTYNHENGTCSCGASGDCSQPASIYDNETEVIFIPGIRVGCYPLNSLLQSTLECLYDQECVDLLRNIFNISTLFSALHNENQSQFYENTSIYSIADALFIESFSTNISYDEYFQICGSSMCSYSYSQRANLIYVLTTLIGLYGGLSISLRLLSPILVQISRRIAMEMKRLFANKTIPAIN